MCNQWQYFFSSLLSIVFYLQFIIYIYFTSFSKYLDFALIHNWNNIGGHITCSDIWRQIKGSVWMNKEQVFFSFSFIRPMARLDRRKPDVESVFSSLEYLSYGLSLEKWNAGSIFFRFFFRSISGGGFSWNSENIRALLPSTSLFSLFDGMGSSSIPELCIDSIHCFTSSVIPQPAGWSKNILN